MKLATLCYVQKDDKTLMLYRNKKENDIHEGKWNGLGGKLEEGETPEECVVREIYEESGLKIKNPKLRGLLTFPKFLGNETWYVWLYTANEFTGQLIENDKSEEGKLEWIANSELLNLNLWEGDRIFLKWVLDEKDKGIFSAKFNYKSGKLKEYSVKFYSGKVKCVN